MKWLLGNIVKMPPCVIIMKGRMKSVTDLLWSVAEKDIFGVMSFFSWQDRQIVVSVIMVRIYSVSTNGTFTIY